MTKRLLLLTLDRVDSHSEHELTSRQLDALRHPARTRIFFALGADGATVSQLSIRLLTNKGNVAHHLQVLHSVGLAEVVRTATVRGGTERYWAATARQVRTPQGTREPAATFLGSVAEEIDQSRVVPLLHLRHLRLDPRQAMLLQDFLDRLVTDLEPGRPTDPRYGVLVSVFGGQ